MKLFNMKELLKDFIHIKNLLIVILTPILMLPLALADGQESLCAYAIIIMAVFWITEALPIAATALLPVFMFPVIGLMSVKVTAQQYINATSMLFVGGLIVAAAIEHWDIHRRIALKILLLFGSEPRWLMLGMMLPTWFLSMWISNTATTAMMVPIANAILLQLRDVDKNLEKVNEEFEMSETMEEGMDVPAYSVVVKVPEKQINGGYTKDDEGQMIVEETDDGSTALDDQHFNRMCKALSLSIAYAANVGGIASLTGTAPNLVFKGQLEALYEDLNIESPVTFANWMLFGVPTSVILVLFIWAWLQIFFLRSLKCCRAADKETAEKVKTIIMKEYRNLGPITFAQGAVIGHSILLAILWISRDMGGAVGWNMMFKKKYVKDAVPAMFIASLLFIFPSKLPQVLCCRSEGHRTQLQPLLSWRVASDKLPWGVICLLGGGFAMAKASQESGLSQWLGDQLSVLDYLAPWVLNMVLCYIMAAATNVTSNTAICTLMMPILSNLAIALKLNPMYLMFPSCIATSFAFMLPVGTPPNAVVFSYGYVRVIDMVSCGFIINVVCVLFLIGTTETLGQGIYDFNSVPDAIVQLSQNVTTTPVAG